MWDIKSEQMIRAFAKELLKNNFRIFYSPTYPVYMYMVYNGNTGHVHYGLGGFQYSTVHVPSERNGSGFGLEEEWGRGTVEMAKRTCLTIAPEWASNARVVKYTLEQFLRKHKNLVEMENGLPSNPESGDCPN